MKTRITELLGIKYPIIQGGMVYISKAPLTSAVSEAGGLGTIAAGGFKPDQLAKEIDIVRAATTKPFGVNIPLLVDFASELVQVAVEKNVPVVILSAGKPDKYIPLLKDKGIKIMQVVATAAMAKKVEQAGVDAVIAEGFEGGGHMGLDELTTMVLTPLVVDAVAIPIVAAGGIADARGVVAALALGAEGVQLGTAFAATLESPAHEDYKKAIIAADEKSTVITGRTFGMMVREIKNKFADDVLALEKKGASKEEILKYVGSGRTSGALLEGDMVEGSIMSGQIAAMIKEVRGVQELFDEITTEIEEVFQRLQTMKSV